MFMSGYEVDKCMTVNYVVVGLSAEQKIKKIINGIEIINCTWWIYISTSQFTQYPHRQSWRICLLFVCSFSNLYFFITPFRYIYMPRSNIIPTVNYFSIFWLFHILWTCMHQRIYFHFNNSNNFLLEFELLVFHDFWIAMNNDDCQWHANTRNTLFDIYA